MIAGSETNRDYKHRYSANQLACDLTMIMLKTHTYITLETVQEKTFCNRQDINR